MISNILLVRKDMDVNDMRHERLVNITLRHKLSKGIAFLSYKHIFRSGHLNNITMHSPSTT